MRGWLDLFLQLFYIGWSDMNPTDVDNRKFKRILFSREDEITAEAYLPGKPRKAVMASLLNISEEGMGLLISGKKVKKLKIGDPVILRSIMTPRPLDQIDFADLEIRNILQDDRLEYATLNCEFINISVYYRKKIKQFIHYQLSEIGSQIFKKSFNFKY
jgi:c-di-GMP-binding flagellar brake protein YcgR